MTKTCLTSAGLLVVMGFLSALSFAETKYEVIPGAIRITREGSNARICRIDAKALYAIESFDKSALIVSNAGYVNAKDLNKCPAAGVIHVSQISGKLGVLSDINLSKRIYVALDFVTVQPYSWLATVARIGSTKNLVSLNGTYKVGMSLDELRTHAFGGSGGAGTSVISPSGRYVAPSGEMTCAEDSYPGVWDIAENKRVITDQSSCSALFLGR
ncbi:hypothetical protein AWB72_05655 [Caballeronia concitans]|uniref:Uncharacterized protein n=2 Tax=Caballeronia concitans TaxID=1777133 RepID=A0A658R5I0_9BURK|nr:hypothetical protein AWB72_05655 [Caballeronia concitans]